MKICVVTSLAASAEPRAPRHAVVMRKAFPDASVVLVDMVARGADTLPLDPPGVERKTVFYPTRTDGLVPLALRKARKMLARRAWSLGVTAPRPALFDERVVGLEQVLKREKADVYFAHNIETLLPAWRAARGRGARLLFDSMEYYSDMGEGQAAIVRAATRRIEATILPECTLVTSSSETLSDVLAAEYGIEKPLALYNMPPVVDVLPPKRGEGLGLYWRNSRIGFSQRGLDDALVALTLLPVDVRLFLQGRITEQVRAELDARLAELGLEGRVAVLPPYRPHEAVQMAAPYDIGLCLERAGPKNHELTVSNKMFDYHMAGLAVVTSDMPSLSRVVQRSGGGLTYAAGSPEALAQTILRLYEQPAALRELQEKARAFALAEGNEVRVMELLERALRNHLRGENES